MLLCRMQESAEIWRTVERRMRAKLHAVLDECTWKLSSESRRLLTKAQVGVV